MERNDFKQTFNTLLSSYLDKQIETTKSYQISSELERIYTFLLPYSTGGKRIRPYLVFLSYKLYGGTNDTTALHFGIFNELVHIFALIHDDINDQGTIRHHLPTFHIYAAQQIGDDYQGINYGILMGDLVLNRAYEHLLQQNPSGATIQLCIEMITNTLHGQMQDIFLSHTPTLYPKEIIREKDKAKSGNYSFMRPMMIGASLAGHSDLSEIQQLGERLGLAFQMRDDLLDIINGHGDKTPFSDHQEGNQTFLFAHAYEAANDQQKNILLETRGHPCDIQTQNQLLEIYTETGTIQRAKNYINEELTNCGNLVEKLGTYTYTNSSYLPYLHSLIDFLRIK